VTHPVFICGVTDEVAAEHAVPAGAAAAGWLLAQLETGGAESYMAWTDSFASDSVAAASPQPRWYRAAASPDLAAISLSRANLRTLALLTSNPSDATRLRFAVRIAGQWFVSDETHGNDGGFTAAEGLLEVTVATALWRRVTFTPSVVLDEQVTAPAAALPGGVIDAVGAYFEIGDSSTSLAQIEDFTLTVIVP
jgi:hypothetical protein